MWQYIGDDPQVALHCNQPCENNKTIRYGYTTSTWVIHIVKITKQDAMDIHQHELYT